MATIYVEKMTAEAFRLQNTSGAVLVQNEFTILGLKCLKACDNIAVGAIGGFEFLRDKVINANTFVSGQATFATSNLAVYWKPASGEFSNTATAANYLVGYSVAPIAGGTLSFIACEPKLI